MKTITEMEWRTLFVERVRHYMKLYNINQAQLAYSIGVTRASISRVDIIISIASVFGCSTDELIMFGYVVMD